MKDALTQLISAALEKLQDNQVITLPASVNIQIDRTRERKHGDFSANTALVLAKSVGMPPRELAQKIIVAIPENPDIEKIEIAGPGFINFYLKSSAQHSIVEAILKDADKYGHSNVGQGQKVLVEFVSANPTGPLHVGHGRGAAYGAAVANLLETIGYDVDREYYVNDAGRQMDILAASVYLRYLEICDQSDRPFPDNAYQGEYIRDIAEQLHAEHADRFVHKLEASTETDQEAQLDHLIATIKSNLGDDYQILHRSGLTAILGQIQTDLKEFGVEYDRWYSEQSLTEKDEINTVIKQLTENGYIYEQEGALWFRSQQLGDEKDRVVVRENGQATYFASDIAYHADKIKRGYTKMIDIWGADHHGYIARIKAALKALNYDETSLDVLLVQFVTLYRGQEKMQMSTRSGQFITLQELREEVGKDATRFFYVMRKSEQHLDFDMELAKSNTKENPVYYIQYAHARICSVLDKLQEQGKQFEWPAALEHLDELAEPKEHELLLMLSDYPELLRTAAIHYDPHLLIYYLKDLATHFHTYYDTHRFLDRPDKLRDARLALCCAVRQVIKNGLSLLGVSAPEVM